MTDLMSLRMKGGPEILGMLDLVPKRFGRSVVRGGAGAAARVICDEAKRNVRRRSGQLARALTTSTRMNGNIISAKVQAKGAGAYKAPWIEYGVAPHWIAVAGYDLNNVNSRLKPKKSGRRRSDKTLMRHLNRMEREGSLVIGGNLVGPYVHHPGSRAFPFMRPAVDTKAAEAINAMGEYMAARLTWDNLRAPRLEVFEDAE